MTENLAVETKKHRLKLFSINPGLLRADMTEALLSAEVPPESPVALVAAWARHEIEAQGDVSPERGAELVVALASGKADSLSGRYISVHDDLDELIERAATIVHKDLYTLRLRQQ
jgi:NAD(P)-dependent dehydrogenase (short-subunit alcohol dehydrogenase family)